MKNWLMSLVTGDTQQKTAELDFSKKTRTEIIELNRERQIKFLSDSNLAEMITELQLQGEGLPERYNEVVEENKKKVESDRKASEDMLRKLLPKHSLTRQEEIFDGYMKKAAQEHTIPDYARHILATRQKPSEIVDYVSLRSAHISKEDLKEEIEELNEILSNQVGSSEKKKVNQPTRRVIRRASQSFLDSQEMGAYVGESIQLSETSLGDIKECKNCYAEMDYNADRCPNCGTLQALASCSRQARKPQRKVVTSRRTLKPLDEVIEHGRLLIQEGMTPTEALDELKSQYEDILSKEHNIIDVYEVLLSEKPINPSGKLTKKAALENLSGITRVYSNHLEEIAKYTLTNMLKENDPQILVHPDYQKRAELVDISVDVNKTQPVFEAVHASYKDMIIVGYQKPYDGFTLSCYAKDREKASEWMSEFENRLMTQNQYRGKCLHVTNGSIRFHDVPKTRWDDVVLDTDVKDDVRLNTVAFLGDKKLSNIGVKKRGVIFYGPPGTGKTSCTKAIFHELEDKDVTRLYVTAESFRQMPVNTLFDLLPYLGKSVLAFEDIDMIGTSRDEVLGNSLLGDLLTNLDGMRSYTDPIVIIASTNKVDLMDAALTNRPCRFDRKIEIGLPSESNLRTIYRKFSGIDVTDDIISQSKGFTGSHVVEVVNTGKILSAYGERDLLDCLKEACLVVRSNFFNESNTDKKEE